MENDWTRLLKKILMFFILTFAALCVLIGVLLCQANAKWKPEFAQATQEVRDWYNKAELTPEARKRFGFQSCCAHSDVYRTQFRVDKTTGEDQWYYQLPNGSWGKIPEDIIHYEGGQPNGEAILFIYNGMLTCFWPPEGGG